MLKVRNWRPAAFTDGAERQRMGVNAPFAAQSSNARIGRGPAPLAGRHADLDHYVSIQRRSASRAA